MKLNWKRIITGLKKSSLFLLFFLFISVVALWYANDLITEAAKGRNYNQATEIPPMKVGLLLGTAPNQFFYNRIDATVELFRLGKIKNLVISGDNSRIGYDEPTYMKMELIKRGIDSTKIYLDYAGFRTFDSMVRVKEIFGQDSILVISQKFHNERAIYIAGKLNIYAIGFNAKDVSKRYGTKTAIREKFARVKVLVDFIFNVQPKFLGEKIEIE